MSARRSPRRYPSRLRVELHGERSLEDVGAGEMAPPEVGERLACPPGALGARSRTRLPADLSSTDRAEAGASTLRVLTHGTTTC